MRTHHLRPTTRSQILRALPFVALLSIGAWPSFAGAAPALMPQPRAVTWSNGSLAIDGTFSIHWTGCSSPMLDRAAVRFRKDLDRLTGMDLYQRPGPRLDITCRAGDPGAQTLGAREAYRLTVTAHGVRIDADGPVGVLRGLATLRQMVEVSDSKAGVAFAAVDDTPRFPWRGVLIDTARHFMSIETVKRQIDAMEQVKLNVLHLHLSDNEGFRVESKRFPKLQELAGPGRYYTQEEVRDLVAYAADRSVRIVPEFDVPGHARALVTAYPEVGLAPLKPANALMAQERTLNPASEKTYKFVAALYAEMSALFPDAYFHVGGDEVSDTIWMDHPEIQAFMKAQGFKTKQDLEAYFHRRVRDIVRRQGKIMIGWEEVAAAGPMPEDVVIQAWQTSNATARAVGAGHQTIVSAGYYLDLLMPSSFYYATDPLATHAAGFTPAEAEAGRKISPGVAAVLTEAVIDHPLPPLTPEQEKLVLGGEAPVWAELITDETLDARLWPRAAAMAERFWSPREVRDVSDLYRRLPLVQDQLRLQGIQDQANSARMAARLSPGRSEPILALLTLVGPVRNYGHDHRVMAALRGSPIVQELNGLADAATADSLVAHDFEARVQRYVGGDVGLADGLRADLQAWRANHARFEAIAKGRPALESALPVSVDITELSDAGLAAIDALTAKRLLDNATRLRAEAVLARNAAFEAASARPLFAFLRKQPPADLIVKIAPAIRALVSAAQ